MERNWLQPIHYAIFLKKEVSNMQKWIIILTLVMVNIQIMLVIIKIFLM